MAYDDFLVDKRVVERHIKKGLVTEEDLKRRLEALPDRESNLVHVSLDGGSSSGGAQVEASSAEDFGADEDDDEDDLDDEDDEEDDEEVAVEPQG